MYRNLSIAVLVAAFALVAGRTALPNSTPTSPVIVRKVALTNQSAPISTTTLFTPPQSGLYRVSVYMTQVVANVQQNGLWSYNIGWSDDAGAETASLVQLAAAQVPPQAWGSFVGSPGNVIVLQTVAGQPVTYSVALQGAADGGGVYSLYFVVERF
jgi:hypothetical protein